jgi:hypothetical protein
MQQTRALFKNEQEYAAKVVHNVNEACALIEDGWKYHTGECADGGKSPQNPNIIWLPISKR